MFELLSNKLNKLLQPWQNNTYISNNNIKDSIREIRKNLLEADVSLIVVKKFIENILNKTIGTKIDKELHPSKFFISIVKKELINILGKKHYPIFNNLSFSECKTILVIGSAGVGKTTTTIKLANFLQKKTMVASLDNDRPNAINQLNDLATKDKILFLDKMYIKKHNIKRVIDNAKSIAKSNKVNYLIFDTVGISHNDSNMIDHLKFLSKYIQPEETLLVVDSMVGQHVVKEATTFNNTLDISGIILTKVDGDHKGGAALSLTHTIKKPIKFIGTGENTNNFEKFYPERIASRILGMGDIDTLVENIKQNIKTDKLKKTINQDFSLEDLKKIILNVNKIGGVKSIISKIPIINNKLKFFDNNNDQQLKEMIAVIDSMNTKEKKCYKNINFIRKKKIAYGSGTSLVSINKLFKQHKNIKKIMTLNKKNSLPFSNKIKNIFKLKI